MIGGYSLADIRKALNEPIRFHNELRKINRIINSNIYNKREQKTVDIIDKDWDNLIILDGCRFDIFEQHNSFPSDPSPIYSKGAHSNEFLQKTFADRELHDTIYVTSNPWSEQLADDTFFLTKTSYTDTERGGKARLPGDITEIALDIFKDHSDKRFIIHFMQPNNPYIGPTAERYRQQLMEEKNILCTELCPPEIEREQSFRDKIPHLRRALRKGYISKQEMLEVYAENLEIVTGHAMKVIEKLGGKTIITSDHGDMFGERLSPVQVKEYSHWEGVHSEILRVVPWLTIESEDRRTVRSEAPLSRDRIDDASMKEQLKTMGYLSG